MIEIRQKKIKVELYNDHYTIYNGSMLDMLEVIQPNSIDSIVCDPPYELNFMNKGWDNSGIAFNVEAWKKCYEALKPGGYLLAFGGSRTFHRMAVAIEDAGFEIRDTIMWIYGSGFPKSANIAKGIEAKEKYGNSGTRNKRKVEQNCDSEEFTVKQSNNGILGEIIETTRKNYIPNSDLSKEWQGWGSALKPAYEPIIVARKPFKTSLVENVMKHGVGGINIDECRVETSESDKYDLEQREISKAQGIKEDGTFLDAIHGKDMKHGVVEKGRFPANVLHDDSFQIDEETQANRYFYSAKVSKKDRDEGLDSFEQSQTTDGNIRNNEESARKFGANSALRRNIHPTVKPCELMQYLVRLVSPKGATILDPFMGSGSTGKAVMFENRERNANYKFIGIDLTEEYCHLAIARIDYALNKFEYDYIKEKQEASLRGQANIFDFIEE